MAGIGQGISAVTGFGYRIATSFHNAFLLLRFSETGRWSVPDCIPTPERGNDAFFSASPCLCGLFRFLSPIDYRQGGMRVKIHLNGVLFVSRIKRIVDWIAVAVVFVDADGVLADRDIIKTLV